MSWLDSIVEKGKSLAGVTCDPPWTVDYDWPLKKQPPSIVSTAPEGGAEMVPVGPLCPDWYTREYIHTSPSTGKTVSVTKWWQKSTNTTQWTAPAGGLTYFKKDFPELYALFAPLPDNAKISDDIDDPDFPSIDKGELAEYVKEIGSDDPEIPAVDKPTLAQNFARAGFQWWHGALIVGGLLFAGAMYNRKKKKKGKRRKR